MRRAVVTSVAIAGCLAVVAHASAAGSKTVKIPLPAPQGAEAMTFTVTVKGTGPIRVRTANDRALGNLALIYAVGKPTKVGATSTWVVDVFIKRFTTQRRTARATAGTVDVAVDSPTTTLVHSVTRMDCYNLRLFDKAFEGGGPVNHLGATVTLQNGRSETEQPSPPEEVFDNVVASIVSAGTCSFKAEGDDPGNK